MINKYFLAKMNIPAYLKKFLYDRYNRYIEIEGIPPIIFKGNGKNLLDYRIFGASGGVGDRTGNFFDGTWENKFIDSNGSIGYSTNRVLSSPVTVIPSQTYTVKSNMRIRAVHSYNGTTHTQALIDNIAGLDKATFTIPANSNSIRISLKKANDGNFTPNDVEWCMLNIGSEALPYEPYGYKVPVVVSGNNLAKWDTYLQPQTNGIVLNDTNSISSIIDVTNINNIYIFGDRTKLNSNVYRIGKSNEPISLNSQTTRITYAGNILDTSDCNYVIVSCSIYNTQTTFDDIKNSFMIVEGTTSPDNFEPYHEPTTTNIYLDNPIRTVEDEVEYIDYSEQKQHRVRKNLLQNTATSQTINGVNVIVNSDGSIKLSGTSTAITYIDINSNFNSTEFKDCYLNPFYPNNFVSSASTVLLRISNTTNRNSIQDFLSNSVIRDNGSNLRLAIRIGQNYTFSNDFVISPMISKFSDNTYEPYIENTEVDVTLPAIPTLDGTNVLTVDTTIQPSKVLIKV